MQFTNEHINCRVVYTARDKSQHLGTVEDVDPISRQVNVKIDQGPMSLLERNWLPADTLTFVPELASEVKSIQAAVSDGQADDVSLTSGEG